MKIIELGKMSRENMNIHISLRMSATLISGFNCQHSTMADLTINEEKKKKKGCLHQEMEHDSHDL